MSARLYSAVHAKLAAAPPEGWTVISKGDMRVRVEHAVGLSHPTWPGGILVWCWADGHKVVLERATGGPVPMRITHELGILRYHSLAVTLANAARRLAAHVSGALSQRTTGDDAETRVAAMYEMRRVSDRIRATEPDPSNATDLDLELS